MAGMTRRDWLVWAGLSAGLGGGLAGGAAGSDDSSPQGLAGVAGSVPLRVVDTHTHFYDTARPGGVPWPGKDDAFLYRPVWPAEFRKLTAGEGVVGTVVVEASPLVEDNQWLLDLAAKDSFVLAVVGNLSPGGEGFRQQLERFGGEPKFRGIRIGHAALRAGLESAGFLDDLRAFAKRGLTLDVNGGPELLGDVARLAAKIDSLKIVVNHLANVAIEGGEPPAAWREGMAEAARAERVWCKLSALAEGASRQLKPGEQAPADPAYYQRVFDVAWQTFGRSRLIYGSNWPVSARYASYSQVQRVALSLVQRADGEGVADVFWNNAAAAYAWPVGE